MDQSPIFWGLALGDSNSKGEFVTIPVQAMDSQKSSDGRFLFRIPLEAEELDQDEEWFSVRLNGSWKTLRIHDYDKLYQTPGLYEALLYDVLECRSPQRLVRLLCLVLENWSLEPEDLRVLDLGAGNGLVGERLQEVGIECMVGVDILQEAADATLRDRPNIYSDYVVTDLCDPAPTEHKRLQESRSNCLITVAALGFGDIPPAAFRNAFNLIETPGWMGLTIKDAFLESKDKKEFGGFIKHMIDERIISVEAQMRIHHRKSLSGDPLFYTALIGRKLRNI